MTSSQHLVAAARTGWKQGDLESASRVVREVAELFQQLLGAGPGAYLVSANASDVVSASGSGFNACSAPQIVAGSAGVTPKSIART
jgi:hypothetical protein